jgi:hypothetical protein
MKIEAFFNQIMGGPGADRPQIKIYFDRYAQPYVADFLDHNAIGVLVAKPDSKGNDKEFYPWSSIHHVTQ